MMSAQPKLRATESEEEEESESNALLPSSTSLVLPVCYFNALVARCSFVLM